MPGQGIPPHVDTHSPFEEVFATLSLKSGATMHFKRAEPDEDGNDVVKEIYLQPRSFVVFSGEARYNWLHSISQRKVDKVNFGADPTHDPASLSQLLKFRHRRISVTFRKVKNDGLPCQCKWPLLCDS